MSRKHFIEFIPLLILLVIVLASAFQLLTSDTVLTNIQYAGLALLGFSILLFFVHRRAHRYMLGITLLLAFFKVIAFTPAVYTVQIIIPIDFQPIVIPAIIAFLIANQDRLELLLGGFFSQSSKAKCAASEALKENFKNKFGNLTDAEIQNRLGNEGMVSEAIQALKEIQEERR